MSLRFHAIVPAAGSGSRMGSDLPKQYLPLGDASLLDRTLEALLAFEPLETIMVALPANDARWQQSPHADNARIRTCTGGDERASSVLNGLRALQAGSDDWIMVHDAARPCVTTDELQSLVTAIERGADGVMLASPVVDTLKRANARGDVEATVSREHLWRALTPQVFRYQALIDALSASLADGHTATDEAAAMERAGTRVTLVEGSVRNIKVTRPEDLALAALFLGLDT